MKNSLQSIRTLLCLGILTIGFINPIFAQTGNVGIGVQDPDASAILHIDSNDKGLLVPRTNSNANNWTPISTGNPEGLIRYDTYTHKLQSWNAGAASWTNMGLWKLGQNHVYNDDISVGVGDFANQTAQAYLEVKGTSTSTLQQGIRSEISSIGTLNYAIHGIASGGGLFNYGVKGTTAGGSSANFGVDGSATGVSSNYGVRGIANGGITNYAVYGEASGSLANDWAGYFSGKGYFSGSVGIGVNIPKTALHVNGDVYQRGHAFFHAHEGDGSSGTAYLQARDDSGSSTIGMVLRTQNAGSITTAMTLTGTGNVSIDGNMGIGAAANSFNCLNIDGGGSVNTGIIVNNLSNSGGIAGINLINCNGYQPGGGLWLSLSDKRLKKDIIEYTDGLSSIRAVNTVTFHYNGEDGFATEPQYVGIIAQELQKIAPYMVKERQGRIDTSKNYLSVDASAFTYMLINSVQELDETVQKQQEIIETQQTELNAIKKALKKAGIELD